MALNNITFVKGKGGLGRPLAGKDYISGLVFYTANGNLPSGFSTTERIKQVFSVEGVEDLGISNDYNDETKATGVYTISNAGAVGDSIALNFTEPDGTVVNLATYVKVATDTTVTILATSIKNVINAGTNEHGYSAANSTGAITITARTGLGTYPNSGTPLVATIVGTIVGSITTPFSGGVSSLQAVWHYHASEFFRIQPKGFLWISFFEVPTTYTYSEIQTVQEFANGDIRQIGVYVDSKVFAVADTTLVQGVCDTLDTNKMPLSVVYAPNIYGVTITALADLQTYSNNKVSVVIGQDADGLGANLYASAGKSVTTLGATLGAVALASVSENIGWVEKFDMSNGVELEGIAFANGLKFTDATVTTTLLDAIDLKRYIFLRKFPNKNGSFFNDSHTAVSQSSDYAYIENNRVIDKAIRGVYQSLLPSLNSPLALKEDGTLANYTVAYLEGQATINTDQMVRDSEASAIGVTIDPVQNVATTSEIVVAISIVPIGVARNIIVNIGFKTSL